MDLQQLQELMSKTEGPKLEFKRDWYSGRKKLDQRGWGEFLKDIISVANGNIGHVGKTGYLIFGLDDDDPLPSQLRKSYNVPKEGHLSNIQTLRETTLSKLKSACSPCPPNIHFEFVTIAEGKDLLVIEIPPSAGVIKLDQDLSTRGIHFRKGTVLSRTGQDIAVADPTEITALEREYRVLRGAVTAQPEKVSHNLPHPDYIRFIGRKDELSRLQKLLHPQDRVWTIVIDGVGGIGKSALALETAHRYLAQFATLSKEERFQAIIWVSAKSTTLTGEGILPRQQITRTLEGIYKSIATTLHEDSITFSPLEDQARFINRLLTRQRTLLIIDNLETIDDERVKAFIRELPFPTKCIVTTRHRIDIADPIRLTGMPREDALSLIDQECTKKGVQLTPDEKERLYKRTGGVPLAMVWTVAQMGYGYSVRSVLHRLGNAKGDIAKFCFENSITQIKHNHSYLMLVCICLSTYAHDRKYLGQIAGLSELDRDDALVELEKLSLVNKERLRYSVLPLVKEYVLALVPDMSFDVIEEIILRISELNVLGSVDALLSLEPFYESDLLIDLKNKITVAVINQMYEWLYWPDDHGASLCAMSLEQLGTKMAIEELKRIAGGTLNMGYHSSNIEYAEKGAIDTLGRLGESDWLLDWLTEGLPYANYLTFTDVIQVIEKYADSQAIPKLDKILSTSNDEDMANALKKARASIISRNHDMS